MLTVMLVSNPQTVKVKDCQTDWFVVLYANIELLLDPTHCHILSPGA